MAERWPRFELVRIGVTAGVPDALATELAAGVPATLIGGGYQALPETELIAGGQGGGDQLVAFGSSGLFGRICLEAGTARIVQVPTMRSEQVNAVNANLPAFTACVQAVNDRFPFYRRDTEPEEWEAVAAELEAKLSSIDSMTQAHVGFWETFISDVTIGDYSTEDVTADE